MNFESLVGRINLIQDALQAQAAHAVNLSLTARRSTSRSLCMQRTCWWDISSIWRKSSAKSQTEVILVDEILRLPTAKLAPSKDDIRKYMLENITEEQFKAMMEEEIRNDNEQ